MVEDDGMNFNIFKIILVFAVTKGASCAEFIDHPRNATVMEGDNITISCIFKDKVDFCRWYRDPGILSIVDVKWRYRYNDTAASGNNTRDCSIIITNFATIDEAFWQCSGTRKKLNGTANITNEFKSNKAHLTMDKSTSTTKATITQEETSKSSEVIVHPQNATVLRGGNILLQCIFKEVILNCVWCRNGTTVKITGRYKYYNDITNGLNTNDCSIEIKRFDQIDATSWQCACAVHDNISEIGECRSNSAYLTMKQLDATTTESSMKTRNMLPSNDGDNGINLSNTYATVIMAFLSLLVIIACFLAVVYCRRSKGRKLKKSNEESFKMELSQGLPRQKLHDYVNLSTQNEDIEDYLSPKSSQPKRNSRMIEPEIHIYEEIPE